MYTCREKQLDKTKILCVVIQNNDCYFTFHQLSCVSLACALRRLEPALYADDDDGLKIRCLTFFEILLWFFFFLHVVQI